MANRDVITVFTFIAIKISDRQKANACRFAKWEWGTNQQTHTRDRARRSLSYRSQNGMRYLQSMIITHTHTYHIVLQYLIVDEVSIVPFPKRDEVTMITHTHAHILLQYLIYTHFRSSLFGSFFQIWCLGRSQANLQVSLQKKGSFVHSIKFTFKPVDQIWWNMGASNRAQEIWHTNHCVSTGYQKLWPQVKRTTASTWISANLLWY